MSAFLDIFTHGRKLQGAIKTLSIEELEATVEKLQNIIEQRKQKQATLLAEQQQKQQKINELRQQIEDAGLDISDFAELSPSKKAPKSQQKRPVKYQLKDSDGQTHQWTGIGRMPLVFKSALDSGKDLSHFKI